VNAKRGGATVHGTRRRRRRRSTLLLAGAAGGLVLLGVALTSTATATAPPGGRPTELPVLTRLTVDPAASGDCKALADIDGDGLLDGIVGGKELAWYRSPGGALTAGWARHPVGKADEEFTTQCQAADVDGDGAADVIVPDNGTLWWFRNPRGSGGDPVDAAQWQRRAIGRPVSHYTHDVAVGDLNGDGKVDVVTKSSGALETWTQDPQSATGWTERRIANRAGEGTVVGDVDGDGRWDIVAGGYWYHNPDWTERVITPSDDGSPAVADVDGDGRNDVVLAPMESVGHEVAWWSNAAPLGSGPWTRHLIDGDAGSAFHNIDVADFDGDGRPDVLVPHMFADVVVYANPGPTGPWPRAAISTEGGHNLVVGDLNGDGRPDVFGSNYVDHPPLWAWRNDPPAPMPSTTVSASTASSSTTSSPTTSSPTTAPASTTSSSTASSSTTAAASTTAPASTTTAAATRA
jgi:hypothetical protein